MRGKRPAGCLSAQSKPLLQNVQGSKLSFGWPFDLRDLSEH
jgi:hypothetical protein